MNRKEAFHEASFLIPIAFAVTAWDVGAWVISGTSPNDRMYFTVAVASIPFAVLFWAAFAITYVSARRDYKSRKQRFKDSLTESRNKGT